MSPLLRPFPRPLTGFLLAALLVVAARAQDPLSVGNPFLPAASAAGGPGPKPTADTPIELRGIMQAGDTTMFSIYDPSHRSSTWLKLGETGRDFIVRRYDAKSDTVSVDFQGRTVTLALKTAKVSPAANVGPAVAAAAPPPPASPAVLNPSPADEQRRLEAIAAEVNRRRQLRQQAIRQQMQQRQPQQK